MEPSSSMNSGASSSEPPAPADTRPPGGTRRSGQKTPRRVQWMFDEPSQAISPSPRALDEHALDVRGSFIFSFIVVVR